MRDKKIKVKSEWRAADKGRHLKRCGYRTRFIIELCICIIIAMIIMVFMNTETGIAAEQIGNEPGTLAGDAASDQADGLTDDLLGELQTDDLDDFLQEQSDETDLDISFLQLLQNLLHGDAKPDGQTVWNWLVNHCFGVVHMNRGYLVQMLVLLLAFAMLQGITGIFSNAFLSDMSFLAVYFLFLYNALRVFSSMQEVTYRCLDRITEFTMLIQPVFCMAMVFSSGVNSASLTYEILLLVLYLVQNLLQKVLFPLVFIYLVTQFANYTWKEEHFSSMAHLLESGVLCAQKILIAFVLGLNLIQGLIAPAVDQLRRSAAIRTIGVIPGLGGAMNSVSELLLGTGILIKNSVGATAVVVLVLLCAKPLLEIAVLTLVYRILAAVSEPVTDKRISGVLDALAKTGLLYAKLVVTAILMLFLSVTVVCMATGAGV